MRYKSTRQLRREAERIKAKAKSGKYKVNQEQQYIENMAQLQWVNAIKKAPYSVFQTYPKSPGVFGGASYDMVKELQELI